MVIKTLACMQLKRLIEKGSEEARVEWKRRWNLDYPYYKSIRGIESEESMTIEERNLMIEWIIARKGWSRKVFENKSDEEVQREYLKVLSERDD